MDLGIRGKTALVLGAGGGLGRAIASLLADEGAKIALGDIDPEALKQTAAALGSGSSLSLNWDLHDLRVIDECIGRIEKELGPVDILVNITGGPPPTTAWGQEPSLWRNNFEAMVLPVIAITDRVLPGMRERKWGRIITSTSSGVISPIPNLAISNALRMSLVGWSKTLSREIGLDGVTANIVLPGRIATDRIRFLDQGKAKRENRSVDSVIAESTQGIPLGRYGEPGEYAAAVGFLASKAASYITGSVIRVDGGMIAGT